MRAAERYAEGNVNGTAERVNGCWTTEFRCALISGMTTQTAAITRDMPYRALNAADERALITRTHDGDADALADLTATYARAIFGAADMTLATATNGRRVRRADRRRREHRSRRVRPVRALLRHVAAHC